MSTQFTFLGDQVKLPKTLQEALFIIPPRGKGAIKRCGSTTTMTVFDNVTNGKVDFHTFPTNSIYEVFAKNVSVENENCFFYHFACTLLLVRCEAIC
jgi:hypothetical protein